MPHAQAILRDLKQALRAVKSGKGWPKNVEPAVSGASGQKSKVGRKLLDAPGSGGDRLPPGYSIRICHAISQCFNRNCLYINMMH